MTTKKYLAYISPLEEYRDKDYSACMVRFASGDKKDTSVQYMMTTSIFRYCFWGVTLEVVEVNQRQEIVDVHDVHAGDLREFRMGVTNAVTYDAKTSRVFAADGVMYAFTQNPFYRIYKGVVDTMLREIETADNFIAMLYTTVDGVIYISFDCNIPESHRQYKYAVHRGFVTRDEKMLKTMQTKKEKAPSSNEKLKQDDIDELINDMLKKG